MEERIDKLLLQRQLVSSRARAEQLITNTGVKVNGKLITKIGKKFPLDVHIELIEEEIPWVSRGALKLLESVQYWQLNAEKLICLDIGASTGGFTEVLLAQNCTKVFAVDVGKDQLHPKIAANERVINLQKTHVRDLTNKLIPEAINACVIDVSFISLTKIFPFIHPFIAPGGWVVALVKPQFEVGKENIGKGGLVKNKTLFPIVLEHVKQAAAENNLMYKDHIDSPILGGDGNKEFLMLLHKAQNSPVSL
jgi:23S rRNA (cytidine1920-2'-O)/16S rRNA (cytidine1409-2'-O)-methyltransferase